MKKSAVFAFLLSLCFCLMGCNASQPPDNEIVAVENMGFEKNSLEEQLYSILERYIKNTNEQDIDAMLESWSVSDETRYEMRNHFNAVFDEAEFMYIDLILSFSKFKVIEHTETTATISYEEITQLSGEANDRMVVSQTKELKKIDGVWKFAYKVEEELVK